MSQSEESARKILDIVTRETAAGEIIMIGTVRNKFVHAGGTREQYAAGLEYAVKHGWLEEAGVDVRLTDLGARLE